MQHHGDLRLEIRRTEDLVEIAVMSPSRQLLATLTLHPDEAEQSALDLMRAASVARMMKAITA